MSGSATNPDSNNAQTSANLTTTSPNSTTNTTNHEVIALAAITEVPSTHDSNSLTPDNDARDISSDPIKRGSQGGEGSLMSSSIPSSVPQLHFVAPSEQFITLLDSGASDHCFVERGQFESYERLDPPRTGHSAGKGSTFNIMGVGVASFLTNTNGSMLKINMDGALHTPNLRSNLLSVSKLVSKGASVSFQHDMAFVYDSKERKVLTAIRKDGLYVVDAHNPVANVIQAKGKAVPFDIWHRRLAHTSIETISRMNRESLVGGLNPSGEAKLDAMCEDCIFGKHTTHPFNNKPSAENDPLDCVYIDIWGPASVESAGRAKYFMLLIDGASSFRTVHFLASKSADNTLKVFKEFHKQAERQTGMKLKKVRLDMGREWMNSYWDDYAKEHGIILDFTTPYAHQQNGKAERSMRTLLDVARTMLADAGLPPKYWADAVHTATYTRNFVPSSRDPKVIPAERWHKRFQDVSHLRPFGSTAYAHIPNEVSPSKLSPRSVKLTLIGYYDRTGYKLLDRATGAVHKSRDVVFEETRPHYSTDPVVTYPLNFDRPPDTNAIAPRPKSIATLHPPPKTSAPTSPVTASTPAPQYALQHVPTAAEDSESEIADMLGDANDEPIALRRSRRVAKPSARMRDSLEYLNRTRANVADAGGLDKTTTIPRNFTEAMCSPDTWFEPMIKELQVMKDKQVYRLVPRPLHKNVVQSKWVFANKYNESGGISGRKARLVAKGFTQILGEDYDETYASVARLESVRLVCAIAASLGLRLWQVDFVSAFLNSENSYEVFMEQPPGFEEGGDHVWLLLKTLYGTMQGAHDWAQTLEKTYQSHRYYTSKADPQVRSRVENNEITLTSTWTDDILGASSSETGEVKAKGELKSSYELKDLGTATFILGMKIDRNPHTGTIKLSQRAYSERILHRFHMNDAKPRSTPLPPGLVLSADDMPKTKEEIHEMKDVPYREALGSLMWLQVATRPDLSYSVNMLSRFANNPGRAHWNAMKHTLGYLKGTLDYGISYYKDSDLRPYGYVDADYAGEIDGRRSTEGHIFFVGNGPVSWASKRQETVALSTVEAEYMAFTRATQQAIWISKFMSEVGLAQEPPVNIFADNTGAIANTQNYKNHSRTKHIDIKYHFTKEKVAAGDIGFTYIPSSDNLADILTKPLAREAVIRCCSRIGLLPQAPLSKQGEC